jgi:hypothetical protein
MTPEENQKLNEHLKGISEILVNNTPKESLKDLESIELAVREHILSSVSPTIGSFFLKQQQERQQDGQDESTVSSEKSK